MWWTWGLMTGGSLSENRTFQRTVESDKRTSEHADNAFTITLRIRMRHEGKKTNDRQRLTKYVSDCSCNCIRTTISSPCALSKNYILEQPSEAKPTPRVHTFRNMRSSDDWATQSSTAVHFPMPPFAANLVQRASS